MLIQQTIDKLKQLCLRGMARAAEEQRSNPAFQDLSYEERLGHLVDTEEADRFERRLARLIRATHFKVLAVAEAIDYTVNRGLDRQVMAALLTCDWIQKAQNVLIAGLTGVGKTWIACALGHQACRHGMTVRYLRLCDLFHELEVARGDGSLHKFRTQLAKVQLLILDDWGLAPLTAINRQDLFELIDDRCGSGSVIITSQLPIDQWHDYIAEPTLADAILDRLVHSAHRIDLRGESLRKLQGDPTGGAS